MNTLKSVGDKLFKTELESQKVKLALDGELKAQAQKAQSIFNDGRKNAMQQIQNAVNEMDTSENKIKSLLKEIDNTYVKAKKTADDLGIDLDSTTVGKNFKQTYSDVEEFQNSARELKLKYEKLK
jgi:DNA repair ATPase RecN